ncbi:hypothetical protein H4R34_005583 [Dimargaris verticillata]|uniref:Uncharacterized protein n=1 Tax=Dimargaris verticillata TaxID=2761393 RepID=A0A9W8EAL3_9FUNG|nr:hypothetical protein H4R34_005583 [Dimargaris verticillata]
MKNKLQELKQEKNAKMYKIAWARYEQPNVNNNNKPTWVLSAKEFKEGFTEDILGEVAHGAIDSNFTNLDAMKAALTEVDVLIDESYGVRTLEGSLRKYGLEDTPAEAMNYKFIKNRMVLRTDGLRTENDGNDWYQSGMVHADVVLQDLIRALYMRQSHSMERYWIRNIASDEHFQFIINDNNTMAHQVSEVKAIGCEEIDWDNVNLRMRKDESSATLLHTSVTAITAVLAVMAGHYYL